MKRNPLIGWVLGAMASIAMARFNFQEKQGESDSKKTRLRIPGPHRPAGSKLARKAFQKRITVRHGDVLARAK